jgi:hypothetical protein
MVFCILPKILMTTDYTVCSKCCRADIDTEVHEGEVMTVFYICLQCRDRCTPVERFPLPDAQS